MWRTAAWMCACAALSAATHNAHTDTSADTNLRTFKVEGTKATIEFVKPLKENCKDWTTLDSMALQPIFRNEHTVCTGSSFVNAFKILNVTGLRPHPPLQALEQCDELREFILESPQVDALPERLLARCPQVEVFSVKYADCLVTLPSKLLENATSLRDLSITHGVLETLPSGLLDDVPNLRFLNLELNRLQTLPSGLFLRQGALQWLHLSSNLLRAEAVTELAGLHSLTGLDLWRNPHLGDLCHNSTDYSPLLHMKKLENLNLSNTNITRICRDWRENLTSLVTFQLASTKITELRFSDLQYIRDESIKKTKWVALTSTPITHIRYTVDDYKASLVAPRSGANVLLWAALECDCNMYWARLALFPNVTDSDDAYISSSPSAIVYGLKCSEDKYMGNVPLEAFTCA